MTDPLSSRLVAAAGRRRRLRFDEYQRIVLYDPEHGYYARNAQRAGREGDFITSPEIAPLFAECLARALRADAEYFGTEAFHVLEVGAGRGTLVREVWNALRRTPLSRRLHFHLAEISPAARKEQARHLAKLPPDRWNAYASPQDLPPQPWPAGTVVANELFDNLPVRRVMQTERLVEIVLHLTARGIREELEPAPVELSAYLEAQGVRLATGQTAEVCLEAPRLLAQLLSHFQRGSVLLIDYGEEASGLYDPDRFPHGTLAAHRAHATHTDYYADPGNQDLTAHVNFTPLLSTLEAAGYRRLYFGSQMKFLLEHGLPELVQHRVAASRDDFEKLRVTQRAKQLYHPEALGEAFRVLHARTL